MTSENPPTTPPMAEHPDLAEVQHAHDQLRQRYEDAAETPMGQLTDGLIILAGLYLAIAPAMFAFGESLSTNNMVVGLAIAVLGFSFASAYGATHRAAWVCPVLGAWMIVSVFVIGPVTLGTALSNVVAGAVALLCGLAMLGTGSGRLAGARPRRSGG
ncbi:hypothetical protein GCM10023321_14210 [Pseudonocardia eucalypti]|uniref:SPW repeat-containing integral membrane domain-containing protein n=1 Tax=Pseudonocardia eucalypti TaxID=648755 RepID=A0ABP9PP54_9PSEU|nr:hypothetical protein [Pseudonocardia eucalypti]